MDGILNINKPPGPTSFDIVAMVRRLSGERHVGHAGTLDPAASGVLPVCLGRATRLMRFLADSTKVYRAQIELGASTDTYDASGTVIATADAGNITRDLVEKALDRFRGAIEQIPPMYSAVKHHGQPLYRLARAGIEVERKRRPVNIHRLEITDWQSPVFTIEVECGKGTYIRSLAHDLGQALGCGAFLKDLVRIRVGQFDIKDAVSVPGLEEAFKHGYWQTLAHPPDAILTNFDAIVIDDTAREKMKQGQMLTLPAVQPPGERYLRAYGTGGDFLGLLRLDGESGQWHPDIVFLADVKPDSVPPCGCPLKDNAVKDCCRSRPGCVAHETTP